MPSFPTDNLLARLAPLTPVDRCNGLVAHVAPDVFGLWDVWEKESGEEQPIPYWAVVWPGAIVLARHLQAHPEIVRDRRVLDLGCGGGFAGIAAYKTGARSVVCNDTDPVALLVAARNAGANAAAVGFDAGDYPAGHAPASQADVVLAADLFYERGTAVSTLAFLRNCLRTGSLVLIADGERKFAPSTGVEVLCSERVTVNAELEGVQSRNVRVLLLKG